MVKEQLIVPEQKGEVSELPSERNGLGTFDSLLGYRSRDGELEAIGGSELVAAVDETASGSGLELNFDGRFFTFYVKPDPSDSDILKTFVSEEVGGVSTDVEQGGFPIRFTETRYPSYAIAPDAFFITFGGVAEKFKIVGGNLEKQTALAGATAVTALAFGKNRVFGAEGKRPIFTDLAAGGDVTTFTATDPWTGAGVFDGAFKRDITNVVVLDENIVYFSPNRIEVKQLEKIQEDDGLGIFVDRKKLTNYGSKDKIGTSTFRKLPKFDDTVIFVNETSKKWYSLVPQKDQNGRIPVPEIKTNRRNVKNFEYDRYHGIYSDVLEAFLIACRTSESSTNDTVFLVDPEEFGAFSKKQWSASSFSESNDSVLRHNSDIALKILRHNPDIYAEEGIESVFEFEINDITDPQFWKLVKIRRLVFWLQLSTEAVVEFFHSVDGGDFVQTALDVSPEGQGGDFVSPHQVLGRGMSGRSSSEEGDGTVEYIIGKAKVKSKGTKIRYKMRITTTEISKLKQWGIPNYKVTRRRKRASLRVSK